MVLEYVISVKMTVYTTSYRDTDMRHLTKGINSHKCIFKRFCHCANVTECTYTNLDSIAYYTPKLKRTAYCS